MLKLYNSLSRKKEVFKPLKGGRVGVYSCGQMRKTYKVSNVIDVSSFRTVSMLPGDRNGLPDVFVFCGGFC